MSQRPKKRKVTAADVEAYERELTEEMPRFKVVFKDESKLQRFIAWLVKPFNKSYLYGYTTVMFGRVYFPSRRWYERVAPEIIYETLRHEAVHLRDARHFPLIFQLSYLFLLPAGLTMRAVWEWRAYAESLRVEYEIHGRISDGFLDRVASRFTGRDYLFMAPFPRYIRRRLEALRAEIEAAG